MTQESTEFIRGYSSGLLHDRESAVCQENIEKSARGIGNTEYPLVAAYWMGYRAALTQLQII